MKENALVDTLLSREDSSKTESVTDLSATSSQTDSVCCTNKKHKTVKRVQSDYSEEDCNSSDYDGSDSSYTPKRSRLSKSMLTSSIRLV